MDDIKIIERWDYAKEHLGAKLTTGDFGRWRLTIDAKKLAETPEFKEYQRLARVIVNGK